MNKRAKIAQAYNMPEEWVCCFHCDRKKKQNDACYCTWNRIKCPNPVDDYCVYFLNTFLHK